MLMPKILFLSTAYCKTFSHILKSFDGFIPICTTLTFYFSNSFNIKGRTKKENIVGEPVNKTGKEKKSKMALMPLNGEINKNVTQILFFINFSLLDSMFANTVFLSFFCIVGFLMYLD